MEEHIIDMNEKNTLAMKLLHYFITEKGYTPIILQGAEDEIWLENLDEDYKVVRLVMRYIHNDEQYKFDVFKTNRIIKKIKAKTLSFRVKVLSIFLDLGNSVSLDENKSKNITAIELKEEKDAKKNTVLQHYYPDLPNKMRLGKKGIELFIKATQDINEHNMEDQKKMADVFKVKKPIITYILILLNVAIYFIGEDTIANFVKSNAILGPVLGGIIGLIPNCASSVILTQLYLENVIPAATMISGLLVGAGVGLIVLFKMNKGIKENLKITGILYAIGVISGIIIQLIGMKF